MFLNTEVVCFLLQTEKLMKEKFLLSGWFVQKALNQDGVLLLVDGPEDASFWYLNVKQD